MSAQAQVRLWQALRGGTLQELSKEGETFRFQIFHPELAGNLHEGRERFFCALEACTRFELQPVRNSSIIITDLVSIERLELRIEAADPDISGVVVTCRGKDGLSPSSLRIRAGSFQAWDEAFDDVAPALTNKK